MALLAFGISVDIIYGVRPKDRKDSEGCPEGFRKSLERSGKPGIKIIGDFNYGTCKKKIQPELVT